MSQERNPDKDRDTLRPRGAFAAPPPAEAEPVRRVTMRPAGSAAVPPPSSLGDTSPGSRARVGRVGAQRERGLAKKIDPHMPRVATDPYFSQVSEQAEVFEFPQRGLFRDNVASFDPALSEDLFVCRRTGGIGAAERAVPAHIPRRASRDEDLPAVGAILDKFRLEELLGVGGFAAVYRATHLLLQAPVAIKMLRPKLLSQKPGLAQALHAEARFAARINHPNVVRVLDVTHTPKITFVVMEYIDGEALSRLIQKQPLSPRRTLELGLEIAEGLAAGLAEGLVHRDVKPANIMLTKSGHAKIVDFGLAAPSSDARLAASTRASGGGSLVGTQGYMAPESSSGVAPDFRADIYSLGVTLYHAVVGALPFWAEDAASCLRLQRECAVPEPHRIRAGVPPALSELLLWMLARRPADRPQSYPELTHAMRRVLGLLEDQTMEGVK